VEEVKKEPPQGRYWQS